jgi:predicted AlkP superfamily pyrophosphatase or phosphodiesterase
MTRRTRSALTLLILLAWTRSACAQTHPTTRPHIARAAIISIDGLRPDVLLRADAPSIRALMQRGSFTMWARTVHEAYTLPAHVSMLTGVTPQRHGVTWDDYIEDSYPQVPTLFERAKRAGFTTGVVSGKMKFIVLNKPGALDWFHNGNEDLERDADVAGAAVEMIRKQQPQVLFVHFADVDVVGHAKGWGSHEQLDAVKLADRAVSQVLAELEKQRLLPQTLVILTADHGGTKTEHIPNNAPSNYVPWIIAGPGIRPDYDLTLATSRIVRLEDTCATVCDVMGIESGGELDGKPVIEALEAGASTSHPTTDKAALPKKREDR